MERFVREQAALPNCRKNVGNIGGIKMLPTQTHGAMTAPRANAIPVLSHDGKVNEDDYVDYE